MPYAYSNPGRAAILTCFAPSNQLEAPSPGESMDSHIQEAALILREGGTVVFPTETVYGLGANAWDPAAVARIFEIKARPHFNPLIVHLPSLAFLSEVACDIPADAHALAQAFWPGPLTLVLPKKNSICGLVTGGLDTVAVRMPAHPVAEALLKAAAIPIAAPSANRFTRLSPTRMEHAREQLGDQVDMYLDGGPCEVGVESTIVGWVSGQATLLRRGGIALEEIEKVIGPVAPLPEGLSRPLAPGGLEKHYAPRTQLLYTDQPAVLSQGKRVGLLAFQPGAEPTEAYAVVQFLSPSGSLNEAAHTLFQKLHDLESLELDLIVARPVPDTGLGRAINDRLRRAGFSEPSSLL
jgi:L-threonylcarbamoyladenylate synthase